MEFHHQNKYLLVVQKRILFPLSSLAIYILSTEKKEDFDRCIHWMHNTHICEHTMDGVHKFQSSWILVKRYENNQDIVCFGGFEQWQKKKQRRSSRIYPIDVFLDTRCSRKLAVEHGKDPMYVSHRNCIGSTPYPIHFCRAKKHGSGLLDWGPSL